MDKREQILRTAIKLFVTQGFENTPTSQISQEAKVATGTLFHHFKTKEDLINQAYLYTKERAITGTKDAYDGTLPVKERLRTAWALGLSWGHKNSIDIDFLLAYSHSAYIDTTTRSSGEQIFEPFTDIFVAGKKEKLFKDLPIPLLHSIYGGIFQSFLVQLRNSKTLDKKIIAKGFDVLWDALKK